jgi:hypothetical protein
MLNYFYYYYSYSFFPQSINLSTADLRNYRTEFHETWWSYRYMFLVDPKVFRFVVKGVEFLPPFLCRVLAAILKMADILKILKMQNCSSNGAGTTGQNFMKLGGVIDICF